MKQNAINIVLIGMPGSGKTTIGKILSKELDMNFYDVDEYIEHKEGKKIKEIFIHGESYFRKLERITVKKISKNTNSVISTGGGVVLDYKNINILKQNGVIFFINRPIERIVMDIDFSSRPLLANDNDNIYRIYKDRYELYKKYSSFEIFCDKGFFDAAEQIIKIFREAIHENPCY